MKMLSRAFAALFALAAPAFATVAVTSPANNSTVGTTVHYAATAGGSSCSYGVASMGVYVDNILQYVSNGTNLTADLPVATGRHNTVVEAWDYCGGATYTSETINVTNQSTVAVSSPANNSTVTSPATYTASGATSCPYGVAAMGVYVNNKLTYVGSGSQLNTQIELSPGTQNTVVEEWDYCGGASYTPVTVNVQQGSTLSNLQASSGWTAYGEFAPLYNICASNCSGVNWSMQQGVSSPSLTGSAAQFNIGGSVPYSDVLWTIPLLGQNTTQGLPDKNHTLLPSIHNFVYDTYVYVTNWDVTQVLEFDISMYMNGAGMIWGQQCDHLADGDWDIWDNINNQWVSTGASCNLNNNAWNHISIAMQRENDNTLLYQSITVNGNTIPLNITYAPFQVPSSWWGVTANYQMDGNYRMAGNSTLVDNFSVSYW